MITKITGEQSFQVLTNNFSISPSNEGYTLQISADGKNFSNLFTVGAGVTRLVTGVAANSYYRLSGNESQVVINWMKTCVTEGGGGSGSGTTYTAGDYISLEGDVISVTGITPSSYATHAEVTAATENLASENYVDAAITAATQNMATEQDIQTAIASETARTENTYAKPGDIPSLSGYATEAFVTGITDTIEDHLDDVERVTATAYTELHQDIVALSGATSGYATHAEVTAATQNLMTSAQTQAAITAATQDFITSAYTGFTSESDFEAFQADVMDKEEVVASALVDIDGRFGSYVQGGGDITSMMRISQADYNDLVSGGTVDSATFYVITGTTS